MWASLETYSDKTGKKKVRPACEKPLYYKIFFTVVNSVIYLINKYQIFFFLKISLSASIDILPVYEWLGLGQGAHK